MHAIWWWYFFSLLHTLFFPQVLRKIINEGEFFFLGRVVKGNISEKMVFKTKGVAKEHPKPFHQLYKLQVKSTWSTRQTLSMEYIKGYGKLPQKNMYYLWQLWTSETRTHRSRTRLESELPPQQIQRPAQCWRAC